MLCHHASGLPPACTCACVLSSSWHASRRCRSTFHNNGKGGRHGCNNATRLQARAGTRANMANFHAHLRLTTAISAADHANHRAAQRPVQVLWAAHSPCSAACAASCAVVCPPACAQPSAGKLGSGPLGLHNLSTSLHLRQTGGWVAGWQPLWWLVGQAGGRQAGSLAPPSSPRQRSPAAAHRADSHPAWLQDHSSPALQSSTKAKGVAIMHGMGRSPLVP